MPHFGRSEQVAFEYYAFHVSVTICGIVDVVTDKKIVYLADKLQAGSKNGNHTINYLYQYVCLPDFFLPY